jgi:hypothetical protein
MAHGDSSAWWADVQHLRSDYERTDEARRRADEADLAAPSRRTVEIRGRTVPAPPVPRAAELDRPVGVPRRRPSRLPVERMGARPDRMALWALLMGVLLIVVAVSTADAATAAAIVGR